MGPSAKRRRLEPEQGMDDSFNEELVFVPTNIEPLADNLDDSFDEDTPIEAGPSLIAQKILLSQQSQTVVQQEEVAVERNTQHNNRQTSEVTNTSAGSSRSVFSRAPSISLQTQKAAPTLIRTSSSYLTQAANKMAAMEYQTGQPQESGHLILLRRRNENMERQLEENRREKVAREMGHLEEKRRLEQKHKEDMKAITEERDGLRRQLLSYSMRGENMMNMSMNGSYAAPDLNTTTASTRSVLSTKPVERVPKPSNKLAWMHSANKGNSFSNNSVFKHPSTMNDTYQHMPTQMIAEDSMFFPQVKNEVQPRSSEDVEMEDIECQTTQVDTRTWQIETSPREVLLERTMDTVLQVPEADFCLSRLEPLFRVSHQHTLLRRAEQPNLSLSKRSSP